jgi:hypothetical protein
VQNPDPSPVTARRDLAHGLSEAFSRRASFPPFQPGGCA